MTHHQIIQALLQIQAVQTQYDAPNGAQCGVDENAFRYLEDNKLILLKHGSSLEAADYRENVHVIRITQRGLSLLPAPPASRVKPR